jgi:hypothetical protein
MRSVDQSQPVGQIRIADQRPVTLWDVLLMMSRAAALAEREQVGDVVGAAPAPWDEVVDVEAGGCTSEGACTSAAPMTPLRRTHPEAELIGGGPGCDSYP